MTSSKGSIWCRARCWTSPRVLVGSIVAAALASVPIAAQQPLAGRNVNMVGGPVAVQLTPFHIIGDPFRAQQNEPSCARSSRNPLHIFCGANDNRLVDLPGIDTSVTGEAPDAWGGNLQSADGGVTWQSRLHPGFRLDPAASPIKGFDAVSDPGVRGGAAGFAAYSGIAFHRGDNERGVLFVSTWLDLNNQEGDPFPFEHVRTVLLAGGTPGRFIDKPWMAVGPPIPGAFCSLQVPLTNPDGTPKKGPDGTQTIVSQTIPASPIYVAYAVFTGSTDFRSKIMFTKSTDCGATWSNPTKVSESQKVNQAVQVAVATPGGGPSSSTDRVVVAWRRGEVVNQTDAMMAVVSSDSGNTFTKAAVAANVCPFDQSTSGLAFRTRAFSSVVADYTGRFYLAFASRPLTDCLLGASAVMMTTSSDGVVWAAPQAIDPAGTGHQIEPTIATAGNKIQVAWVDFRNDAYHAGTPPPGTVVPPPGRIDDTLAFVQGGARHTAEIRGAQAALGNAGSLQFTPHSISEYVFGIVKGEKKQLQFSPWNIRLFAKNTVPFDGDYHDVTGDGIVPTDPLNSPGLWGMNKGQWGSPSFLSAFTDNRNVKLSPHEDPTIPRPYSRPNWIGLLGAPSIGDPTAPNPPVCTDDNSAGAKNQDVYAVPITPGGFVIGSPGNSKSTLRVDGTSVQRAFVVFVRNTDAVEKHVTLDILNQPVGGRASFDQFAASPSLAGLTIAPRSTLVRSVYVKSTAQRAPVNVKVSQTDGPFTGTILLNADPSAPIDLVKPGTVPNDQQFDPNYFETHDVDVGVPYVQDISLPGSPKPPGSTDGTTWENPEWENPEWENPEWENPEWENPEWENPEWENPEWENPEWENPEWENGSLSANDIQTGSVRDVRFSIKGNNNTSSGENAVITIANVDPTLKYQLVGYELYPTQAISGCKPGLVGNTQVAFNLTDPAQFLNVPLNFSKANFAINPGKTFYLNLRIWGPEAKTRAFDAGTVQAQVQAQAVNTAAADAGQTVPPVITSLGITTTGLPTGVAAQNYAAIAGSTLTATGGTAPYTWSATGLPAGLAMSPTGQITGSPVPVGLFNVVARVEDSAVPTHRVATRNFVLKVAPQLAFTTQPGDAAVDEAIDPRVAVAVFDGNNSAVSGFTVTLVKGPNSGAGLLSSVPTVSDASGIATFPDVRVDTSGTYRLVAQTGFGGSIDSTSTPSSAFFISALSGTAFDPLGDAGNNPDADLRLATVTRDGDIITAEVHFNPTTFVQGASAATLFMDLDQDATTGQGISSNCSIDTAIFGVEYLMQFPSASIPQPTLYKANPGPCVVNNPNYQFVSGATFTVTPLSDGYRVSFSRGLIGGDDGRMTYKVVSDHDNGNNTFSGIADILPDQGTLPVLVDNSLVRQSEPELSPGAGGMCIGPCPDLQNNPTNQSIAQVLVAGSSGALTEVRLPIFGTGSITVEIRGVTNGVPNATVLASQTFNTSPGDAFASGMRRFIFSQSVSVSGGTQYAIVLSSATTSLGLTLGPVGNFYPGGDQFFLNNGTNGGWVTSGSAGGFAAGRFDGPFEILVIVPIIT
jgi:hypothetical protein